MSEDQQQEQTKTPRFFAVLKSRDTLDNTLVTLAASTRKELAASVAKSVSEHPDLEVHIAVRGKKLEAQEKRTVQFS